MYSCLKKMLYKASLKNLFKLKLEEFLIYKKIYLLFPIKILVTYFNSQFKVFIYI